VELIAEHLAGERRPADLELERDIFLIAPSTRGLTRPDAAHIAREQRRGHREPSHISRQQSQHAPHNSTAPARIASDAKMVLSTSITVLRNFHRALPLFALLLSAAPKAAAYSFEEGREFLKSYCAACHQGKSPAAGFSLSRIDAAETFGAN